MSINNDYYGNQVLKNQNVKLFYVLKFNTIESVLGPLKYIIEVYNILILFLYYYIISILWYIYIIYDYIIV